MTDPRAWRTIRAGLLNPTDHPCIPTRTTGATPDTCPIIGFHPAAPGWRVAFLADDTGYHLNTLAGWVMLDDPVDGRRIVAGVVDQFGEVVPVAEFGGFWRVLSPNDAEPTEAEAEGEKVRRAEQGR